MTRGEIGLTAIIFVMIYAAGLLPRLVARLTGVAADGRSTRGEE